MQELKVGATNFFRVLKITQFITPYSPSVLPSITKYSLLWLTEHRLGMTVKGDVYVDQLDIFAETGACGTAAVISPVGRIQNGDNYMCSILKQKLVCYTSFIRWVVGINTEM